MIIYHNYLESLRVCFLKKPIPVRWSRGLSFIQHRKCPERLTIDTAHMLILFIEFLLFYNNIRIIYNRSDVIYLLWSHRLSWPNKNINTCRLNKGLITKFAEVYSDEQTREEGHRRHRSKCWGRNNKDEDINLLCPNVNNDHSPPRNPDIRICILISGL